MIIGLGPEYNYEVSDHSLWKNDSTLYASNHGASLISRTLIEFFDGDYISDLSQVEKYREQYDLCVIAFATHITNNRDVSPYADFVKKLGIKTVAFSLGIQDYSGSSAAVGRIHPSLKELLDYVIDSSGIVGVRGPFTASVLVKNGYSASSIREIGCPTMYRNLDPDMKITKPGSYSNPRIVYHRTMAGLNETLLEGAPFIGQDFLDEVVFDQSISEDQPIRKSELEQYSKLKNAEYALSKIRKEGIFHRTFQPWWEEVGKADFVVGARLHGSVAALLQGIPAVMLARDIRVKEIATFYGLPFFTFDEVAGRSIADIFDEVSYAEFNSLYKFRYNSFMQLLADLDLAGHLSFELQEHQGADTSKNLDDHLDIIYAELFALNEKLDAQGSQIEQVKITTNKLKKVLEKLNKLPGSDILKGFLK